MGKTADPILTFALGMGTGPGPVLVHSTVRSWVLGGRAVAAGGRVSATRVCGSVARGRVSATKGLIFVAQAYDPVAWGRVSATKVLIFVAKGYDLVTQGSISVARGRVSAAMGRASVNIRVARHCVVVVGGRVAYVRGWACHRLVRRDRPYQPIH